nr:cupin domain-containing protein [Halochromatium glycolicum]
MAEAAVPNRRRVRTRNEPGPIRGGAFCEHSHSEGGEILVLDGVFSDEHGEYPTATFLMNPDGSRHSPRSECGCTLLVRLRQSPGSDRPRLFEDTLIPQR